MLLIRAIAILKRPLNDQIRVIRNQYSITEFITGALEFVPYKEIKQKSHKRIFQAQGHNRPKVFQGVGVKTKKPV